MTEGQGQPLKFAITHYRKPQHTYEDFIKWIVEGHLPFAIPVFKKHGILGYTLVSVLLRYGTTVLTSGVQFVTPPTLNSAMKEDLGKYRSAWDFADFDCFIEYVVPYVQSIKNVMADPEWLGAVKEEEHRVDTSKALATLGYATQYLLQNGETVTLPK